MTQTVLLKYSTYADLSKTGSEQLVAVESLVISPLGLALALGMGLRLGLMLGLRLGIGGGVRVRVRVRLRVKVRVGVSPNSVNPHMRSSKIHPSL